MTRLLILHDQRVERRAAHGEGEDQGDRILQQITHDLTPGGGGEGERGPPLGYIYEVIRRIVTSRYIKLLIIRYRISCLSSEQTSHSVWRRGHRSGGKRWPRLARYLALQRDAVGLRDLRSRRLGKTPPGLVPIRFRAAAAGGGAARAARHGQAIRRHRACWHRSRRQRRARLERGAGRVVGGPNDVRLDETQMTK